MLLSAPVYSGSGGWAGSSRGWGVGGGGARRGTIVPLGFRYGRNDHPQTSISNTSKLFQIRPARAESSSTVMDSPLSVTVVVKSIHRSLHEVGRSITVTSAKGQGKRGVG